MAPYSTEKETRFLETVLKNRPDSLLFARLADAYRKEGNIGQAIDLNPGQNLDKKGCHPLH